MRQLLLGVYEAAGDSGTATLPEAACLTKLAEKGINPELEDSYDSDEEEHEGVDPTIAARGLVPMGCVPLQNTL